MASKRDAWTRSSWGSLQTLLLTPLNFEIILQILPKSLTQVPMRSLTETYLENIYFGGGLGGGQRPAQKGDAGTQVLCHEVPGWLCSLYRIPLKNTSLLVVLGRAKSASTGMRGHKSYVMIFLSDLVLETCETTCVCWPAKLSSKYRGQKSLFDVPGSFCSRNVW